MQQKRNQQAEIRLGSHGEDYGSWMSNPVFYIIGGITALAVVLAILLSVFHITALGVLLSVVTVALAALLVWITWIRRQYAFGGGGIMEQVHRVVLSHLDYDGQGSLFEVGCGSGALSIRAGPDLAGVKGHWHGLLGSCFTITARPSCEKNAASEGVASGVFRHGDANHLDFPDESFDAVISNYVYHNVMGSRYAQTVAGEPAGAEKGGVFALNDDMKPKLYGDMDVFAQNCGRWAIRTSGSIDTAEEAFRFTPPGCHDDAGLFPATCGQKVIRPNRRVDHVQVGCCRGHAVCPHAGQDLCQRKYCPQILYDPKALELKKKLPSGLPEQDGQSQYTLLLASAARSANMDRFIRVFLERRPDGVIVQLGCGLETAYFRCDNGRSRWYAVDLPHVVEYRRELLPESERETYPRRGRLCRRLDQADPG